MFRFRQATPADLPAILVILNAAIARLGAAGVDQWQHGYPNPAAIEADVAEGTGYLIEQAGHVVAYGAVIFTGEEAYCNIEGAWLTDGQHYVVVHRLCVAEEFLGEGMGGRFMAAVESLAAGRVRSIRIDTHAENRAMLSLLDRLAFRRCGIIRIEHRDLIAFEKLIEA